MAAFTCLIQKVIDSGKCRVAPDYHGPGAEFYDLVQTWQDDLPYYLTWAERQGSPILELGAGTGRVLLPLARAGYRVTGLEASPDMLSILERKLSGEPADVRSRVTLLRGDMRDLCLNSRFCLILLPLHTLSHLLGYQDRLRVFRAAARHLVPGGVLVADVELGRPEETRTAPPAPVLSGVHYDAQRDSLLLILTHERPVQAPRPARHLELLYLTVDAEGKASLTTTVCTEELTPVEELRRLMEEAGLKPVGLYRNYAEEDLREEDPTAVAVARKPR